MILWRISNYETLDGSGGMKASGRWHTQGRRVVYLSSSPSSALLEILVHLEISTGDVPRTYRLLEILVPPNMVIQRLRDLTQLPEDWGKEPIYYTAAWRFLAGSKLCGPA